MENFLVHNNENKCKMLNAIGLSSIEELFSQIPKLARVGKLNLPEALSEMDAQRQVKTLAKKNKTDYINFLGGGVYNKFIPAGVGEIARRFEFLTAYTPYQAEISQGTLQIMYEFQTMISRLTGMDISNATVYDAGTACAEAIIMAKRISKKSKVLVSVNINPEYKKVIDTYTWANGIEVTYFENIPQDTSDYAGVLIQMPDYYGEIFDILPVNSLLIVCTDVSSLSILKPPSEYGADIVIGDVQTLGIPMEFGGPHAGFIACREKYMRQLPGRLAGRTLDAEGKQAFCLTVQTREQHIKREKATSNICSNQAIVALCATVYLSLLGENGFRQAGYLSAKQAHILSEKLGKIGIKTLNKNFFNEFVIQVNNAEMFLSELKTEGILGGIQVSKSKILVAVTEMITDNAIDLYVKSAAKLL